MAVEITVSLDTSEFVKRLDFAAREAVNAMRRTVDKTARAARRDAIKTMARDIGVPASKFRDAVPLVKASTQTSISASWIVSKKPIGALNVGSFTPGMSWNRGSYTGSTFRVTGGGSSSLNIGKAFVLKANGGVALMVRSGGKIKAVYIEMPSTSMGQDGAAPRKDWQRTADATLGPTMAAEIQRALDGVAGGNPDSAPRE